MARTELDFLGRALAQQVLTCQIQLWRALQVFEQRLGRQCDEMGAIAEMVAIGLSSEEEITEAVLDQFLAEVEERK
jgi:hypothetical protein